MRLCAGRRLRFDAELAGGRRDLLGERDILHRQPFRGVGEQPHAHGRIADVDVRMMIRSLGERRRSRRTDARRSAKSPVRYSTEAPFTPARQSATPAADRNSLCGDGFHGSSVPLSSDSASGCASSPVDVRCWLSTAGSCPLECRTLRSILEAWDSSPRSANSWTSSRTSARSMCPRANCRRAHVVSKTKPSSR